MKAAILFVVLLMSCQGVNAGTFLNPSGVVEAAIKDAYTPRSPMFVRCCDLAAIAADPTDPMSGDALVSLFSALDISKVAFQPAKVPDDEARDLRVTIQMSSPRRITFDLVGTREINGVLWRIVAVHPQPHA